MCPRWHLQITFFCPAKTSQPKNIIKNIILCLTSHIDVNLKKKKKNTKFFAVPVRLTSYFKCLALHFSCQVFIFILLATTISWI